MRIFIMIALGNGLYVCNDISHAAHNDLMFTLFPTHAVELIL